MNDQITTPTSEAVDPDFEGSFFDEWIAGANPSRRAVTIYSQPGLFAEYQQVARELEVERAVAAQGGGDEMGGSPIRALEQREQDIYDRWQASRSTWIVEMIDDDAIAAAKEGLDEPQKPVGPERPVVPVEPKKLAANATEQQKRSHTVATNAYRERIDEHKVAMAEWEAEQAAYTAGPYADWEKLAEIYADEVNLRLISAAVREIRDVSDTVRQRTVTVEQLRKLSKTLGKTQVLNLMAGIQGATYEETVIPAPFSQSSSEDDPTS